MEAVMGELSKSQRIQMDLWAQAVAATRLPGPHPDVDKLVVPTLNEMIDIAVTRTMAARIHPPGIIFGLLFLLALVCSLLAGYAMADSKRLSWLHITSFVVVTVVSVFVVLDIEYPRLGLIRVDQYDQVLVVLRHSMD